MIKLLLLPFCFLLLFSCRSEKKYKPVKNVADILENIQPALQEEEIDPAIDNIIRGKKGTAVYIPANCLELPDGTRPKGKVSITLKECYSAADFLSNGLSATSDSFLLETGGMIYLSAKAGDRELAVNKNKSFVIAFPGKDTAKPMETFYGVENKAGVISWKPAFPRGEGGSAVDLSLQSDSSLYQNKFTLCGYTAFCNDYEVDWRIQHPDSTLFNYIRKRMVVPDSIMKTYRNRLVSSWMNVSVKAGKIRTVRFDRKDIPTEYKQVVTNFLKAAPPLYIKDNNECFQLYHDGIVLDICYSPVFDTAKYNQRFNQKYGQYKTRAIAKIDPEELNYYMLSSTKLGWINCDRFLDVPEKKADYIVKVPQAENTRLQLVFSDLRSVMQGEPVKGGFVFRHVPLGRMVKIIAVAYQNGKPTLSTAQTSIGETPYSLSGFKEFSLAALEKELAAL